MSRMLAEIIALLGLTVLFGSIWIATQVQEAVSNQRDVSELPHWMLDLWSDVAHLEGGSLPRVKQWRQFLGGLYALIVIAFVAGGGNGWIFRLFVALLAVSIFVLATRSIAKRLEK